MIGIGLLFNEVFDKGFEASAPELLNCDSIYRAIGFEYFLYAFLVFVVSVYFVYDLYDILCIGVVYLLLATEVHVLAAQ